jgi:hypothetical protein
MASYRVTFTFYSIHSLAKYVSGFCCFFYTFWTFVLQTCSHFSKLSLHSLQTLKPPPPTPIILTSSGVEVSQCAQNSQPLWQPRAFQIGRLHHVQFNARLRVAKNEKQIKIQSTTVPGHDYVSACLRIHTQLTHRPIRDYHRSAANTKLRGKGYELVPCPWNI